MNSKIIILALVIIAFGTLGYYFFNNQNNIRNAPIYNQDIMDNSNSISVPIKSDAPGVESVNLIYTFSGKLATVVPVANGYKWILENSDPTFPQFIVTNDTLIFKEGDKNLEQVQLTSVKNGVNVAISMSYNFKTKGWTLNTVTIKD